MKFDWVAFPALALSTLPLAVWPDVMGDTGPWVMFGVIVYLTAGLIMRGHWIMHLKRKCGEANSEGTP